MFDFHSNFDLRPARKAGYLPLSSLAAALLFCFAWTACAQTDLNFAPSPPNTQYVPDVLKNIAVNEHLNAALPLDAAFVDDRNQPVTLRQYFNGTSRSFCRWGITNARCSAI